MSGCLSGEGVLRLQQRESSMACPLPSVPAVLSGERLSLAATKMVSLRKQTEEASLFSQNQQCLSH